MNNGWLKLYRKITESSVFDNPELLKVWIWCLCKATHRSREQIVGRQIITLEEGQFVFGRKAASEQLKMNESAVYRHIKMLEALNMISIKTNNKFSLITIEKWTCYQGYDDDSEQQMNSKRTADEQQMNSKRTANEQQVNTNKNDKNDKNDKNVRMEEYKNNIHTASAVRIDYQHYVDLYNSHCSSLPQVKTLNEKRKRLIKRVAKEVSEDDLLTAFNKANTNPFLRGDNGGGKANFDWLMNPDNITKVLEGNYDRGKTQNSTNKDYSTDFGIVIEV